MPRFAWTDLADAEHADGAPNQGLTWGTLWAQQKSWRNEQWLAIAEGQSAPIVSGTYAGSPIVTQDIWLPPWTEEVSVMVWFESSSTSNVYVAKVDLWFDGSNEWPLLWNSGNVRGEERELVESPELSVPGGGNVWAEMSYEGCGLKAEDNYDSVLSGLTKFELRLNAKAISGPDAARFEMRALFLQQKDSFYFPTDAEIFNLEQEV